MSRAAGEHAAGGDEAEKRRQDELAAWYEGTGSVTMAGFVTALEEEAAAYPRDQWIANDLATARTRLAELEAADQAAKDSGP
jgi:hypothetical protein